jgi:hypothetical protein
MKLKMDFDFDAHSTLVERRLAREKPAALQR